MFTLNDLQKMSQTDEVGRGDLVDINDVKIDDSLPATQRMENYLSQMRNPYHFLCGEIPVIITFSNDNKTLSQKLEAHFIRQKAK